MTPPSPPVALAPCLPGLGDGQRPSTGNIALVEDGDLIEIDVPGRRIELRVSDEDLQARRQRQLERGSQARRPAQPRVRQVSAALRAYAAMTTSAGRGAVRDVSRLQR